VEKEDRIAGVPSRFIIKSGISLLPPLSFIVFVAIMKTDLSLR
jgi:hypothetical protein